MTDDELKAIRDRLAVTTPGPWEWCKSLEKVERNFSEQADEDQKIDVLTYPETGNWYNPCLLGEGDALVIGCQEYRIYDRVEDAVFLQHSQEDIAALLAEVERLQERCEQLYYDGLEE